MLSNNVFTSGKNETFYVWDYSMSIRVGLIACPASAESSGQTEAQSSVWCCRIIKDADCPSFYEDVFYSFKKINCRVCHTKMMLVVISKTWLKILPHSVFTGTKWQFPKITATDLTGKSRIQVCKKSNIIIFFTTIKLTLFRKIYLFRYHIVDKKIISLKGRKIIQHVPGGSCGHECWGQSWSTYVNLTDTDTGGNGDTGQAWNKEQRYNRQLNHIWAEQHWQGFI